MADEQDNQGQSGDTVQVPPLAIDDPRSDAAIDDIVAQEADEVLAAEDAKTADEAEQAVPAEPVSRPHGHPIFWFVIAFLAILALVGGFLLLQPGLSFAP